MQHRVVMLTSIFYLKMEKLEHGATSLLQKVQNGHGDACNGLLRIRGNINEKQENGTRTLFDAATNGQAEECIVLFERNAHSTQRMDSRATILFQVAQNGHAKVCIVYFKIRKISRKKGNQQNNNISNKFVSWKQGNY